MIPDTCVGPCVEFPRDIFFQLSQELSYEDLVRTARVSKIWYLYSNDEEIWQHKTMQKWPQYEAIEGICWKEYFKINYKGSFFGSLKHIHNEVFLTNSEDIIILSLPEKSVRFQKTDHKGVITQLLFYRLSRNSFFFSAGSDGYVKIWDKEIQSPALYSERIHQQSIVLLQAFGHILYSASTGGSLKRWQITEDNEKPQSFFLSLRFLEEIKIKNDMVTAVQIFKESLVSHFLLTGSQKGKIYIWHTSDPKSSFLKEDNFQAHDEAVTVLKLDNKSLSLFSGSSDKTIKIWKKQKSRFQCMQIIKCHEATITSLLIDRFTYTFHSSSLDGKIYGYTYDWQHKEWIEDFYYSRGNTRKIISFEIQKNYHYNNSTNKFTTLTSDGEIITFEKKEGRKELVTISIIPPTVLESEENKT